MGLNGAWKIALVYALFSLAWILGSDRLFLLLFPEPQELTRWQTGKGLTFVFLSSLLIYLLSRREALAESARRKALEASQRRLHALVENGRELIYLISPQGQILYASPNVAQVLGYDPLGYTRETLFILDFVHPEDRPYAEAALEGLLRHPGETREYRLRLLDAWGRVRAVRVWGKNLLEDPAVRGIVINVHDETELEEERARLKGVLEALPGAVYQVRVEEGQDPAYAPLVYATPRQAWEVLGHPAEALLEDPAFFFAKVHPEDRAKVEEAVRRAVAHPGEVQIATYRFLHGQKGTYVWLRDTLIYDPETRLLTGYTYDVNQEVAWERTLRESEALFRTLAETAPALILLWQLEDPEDPASARLTFANQEALRLTGYSLEELQARPIWEFVHPADREAVRARGLARLRGETPPTRYPFRILTKEGEVRWLDYSAARVELGGRPAVLGVGLDVTEAKERERTLEAFARVSVALRQSEDLQEMMEHGLQATLAALEAEAGAILLYEGTPPRLVARAERGWIRNIPHAPTLKEPSLVALALKGEVVVSPDLKGDPRVREAARPYIPEGYSGLALPVLAGR
ncbi:PAS domain S-box-containing protein [Thermus arciformis]|uniref:histidine kinase n=1 Tax=Thermus arciformis TaxID=482827 RepID=A0A1G7DLT4_9DEIN|nr:PAS domain S-box protein [Thermus arciformis]SDE52479.1 PAS domain S-box-containing protein [Thermus arciformis]